jgi:hypothetical protein
VLYKGKGDPLDPNSYRGISLTAILAKMYERILLARLKRWTETTTIAQLPQFGFKAGSSTTQAVFVLQSVVHEVVSVARKALHAVFVDLTKAFPSLDRDRMFAFLQRKGVPPRLLRAIRSFYVGNSSKLRVDNLLSVTIHVTLGVLEGSVLSPFLFSTVFSMVWDFVTCTEFPNGRPRVLQVGEVWLIAFADDLVILSLSVDCLQSTLTRLFDALKEFNLIMSLTKTETLTFVPPRLRRGLLPTPSFNLHGSELKQVSNFKYLGMFVQSQWSFSNHIARMSGRAEAASAELRQLVEKLQIRHPGRLTQYYRCLVESQWHGLELLPVQVVKEIESTRSNFIRLLYDLPSSTANALSLVIFDLWPVGYECLRRRQTFLTSVENHEMLFVRDAMLFDKTILFRERKGWHFEAFQIFVRLFPGSPIQTFDLSLTMNSLERISNSRDTFLYLMVQATDEATLAPFRLFSSSEVLCSFRDLLGDLSPNSSKFLLLFLTSGHRFRFFARSRLSCPHCSQSWLTSHFFTCRVMSPLLQPAEITLNNFETYLRGGLWGKLLHLIFEVVTLWKGCLEDCTIDDEVLRALRLDADRF